MRLVSMAQRLGILLLLPAACRAASLKRPASSEFTIDFDDVTLFTEGLPCDFALGNVVRDQYASMMARFSGPGFGGLNGGVAIGGCTLGTGELPPLSNSSFHGVGMLGFSTLHTLSGGRTGKPVSPETVRFDVRMTNIRIGISGLDGHAVTIELYTGAFESYDDPGELIRSYAIPVTESLAVHELIDERDVFVDCVRRVRFYSTAKIFVVDDFSYEVTLSDDDYCGLDPSRNDTTTEDISEESLEATSAAAAAAGCPPWWWASAVACSCAASMVGLGRGVQTRRRGKARPSRRGVARRR
tara:strand:- start:980 stop:1876 length:897 start_codon:yes stop_codon:yes gene_type:complete